MNQKSDQSFLPDYKHWLRRDTWQLDDAIYLILESDPKQASVANMSAELSNQFDEVRELALDCEGHTLKFFSPSRYEEIAPNQPELIAYGRIQPSTFIKWASMKEFEIPKPLQQLLCENDELHEAHKELTPVETISRIDQRAEIISELAKIWFEDVMSIPRGGKENLKRSLLISSPGLFTNDTFDKAWQKAKRNKTIEVEDVGQYKGGK